LFAASISPTVTGLLDTRLTHVSSDVVKVSWLFAKGGPVTTLLERFYEMSFDSSGVEKKKFYSEREKMNFFSKFRTKKRISYAVFR
jgi:hypothetical protein